MRGIGIPEPLKSTLDQARDPLGRPCEFAEFRAELGAVGQLADQLGEHLTRAERPRRRRRVCREHRGGETRDERRMAVPPDRRMFEQLERGSAVAAPDRCVRGTHPAQSVASVEPRSRRPSFGAGASSASTHVVRVAARSQ